MPWQPRFPPSTTPSRPLRRRTAVSPLSVVAGNGASWVGRGVAPFSSPSLGMWLLVIVILVVLSMVLAVIPVVGHLASQVLFPVFHGRADAGLSRRSTAASP